VGIRWARLPTMARMIGAPRKQLFRLSSTKEPSLSCVDGSRRPAMCGTTRQLLPKSLPTCVNIQCTRWPWWTELSAVRTRRESITRSGRPAHTARFGKGATAGPESRSRADDQLRFTYQTMQGARLLIPAARKCPGDALSPALGSRRAQGTPDAGRTREPCVQKTVHLAHAGSNRAAETIRRSLRNGFTAYTRSPRCPGVLATVACKFVACKLDPSVGGSGPRDFAVRIGRIRLMQPARPSHPAPTFVTIASRPSVEESGTGARYR
jgi:hypothetical protein